MNQENEASLTSQYPQVAPHGANSYRAIIKDCGRGGAELSVFVPDARMFQADKLPPSLLPKKELSEEEQIERNEANAKRAARRARQMLRLILKSMDAKYLWTFTFRENVTDIALTQKYYKRFHELFRKRYPDSKFVTIPEQQERGAWHLHVAVSERLDIHWVLRCWYIALGHKVKIEYDVKGKPKVVAYVRDNDEWRIAESSEIAGSVNVRARSRKWGGESSAWDSDHLSSYMAKYMDKNFSEAMGGKKRYWPSKDCQRPRIEKFWLMATNVEDALKESFYIVKTTLGMANTRIFLSKDYMTIWISGSGCKPPF